MAASDNKKKKCEVRDDRLPPSPTGDPHLPAWHDRSAGSHRMVQLPA